LQVALVVSSTALLPGVSDAATATVPCRWTVVDTPGSDGQLQGVSGTSSTDVWAVGLAGFDVPPITLHWDGTAWAEAPQQPVEAWLLNVAAIAPADAWAVGYRPTEGGDRTLAMHWDGALWRVVPVPDFPLGGRLLDVSALSSADVWAVGYYVTLGAIRPLTVHWDGTSWRQVPAPEAGSDNTQLNGVDMVAPDDVWAVGIRETSGSVVKPVIEHWDGSRWTATPSPPTPGDFNYLYAVSGSSSSDVWAVGFMTPDQLAVQALIEHWDGSVWRLVRSPLDPPRTELFDVAVASATDAWAVG